MCGQPAGVGAVAGQGCMYMVQEELLKNANGTEKFVNGHG